MVNIEQQQQQQQQQQQRAAMLKYLNSFPPGYRFCPTDKELVLDYLRKKVMNKPLPPNKIMDINLYNHGPQDLSAIYREKMCVEPEEKTLYFFTPRDRKYPNGIRPNRAAGLGYWKATGVDNIIGRKENPVGYRKSLVYYEGYPKKSKKTNWIMHEYRIDQKSPARSSTAAPHDMKLDDWVLCKVYLKEKQSDKDNKKTTGTDTDDTETNTNISSSISETPPLLMQSNYNYNNVPDVHGYTSSAAPPLLQSNYNYNNVPDVHGYTSSAAPPSLQSNNNVANINLGATSSASPLQSNNNVANINLGATSSAAPPMETINYSNIMFDQQFSHGYDCTSSLFEEVWNNCLVDLPAMEFPPNFDDV